jgi:4-hydroxy-tetrahydrodipicolinate reductase
LIVNGAGGRMGRLVASALRAAGLGPLAGCDPAAAGPLLLPDGELPLVPDLESALEASGVVVDFSHPDATRGLCDVARRRRARLVVGTTGQSEEQLARLREAAREVPVVLSRNFSLGVNRLLQALPQLRVLTHEGFDVECLEAHHRQKRDAPSGTALLLLEALLGEDSSAPRVHGRHGPDALRRDGEVGVHSLRLGQLAGEHALLLASDHELLEIRHRALDRMAFVSGVVPAVRFVKRRPPGLYSMLDVMRNAQETGS